MFAVVGVSRYIGLPQPKGEFLRYLILLAGAVVVAVLGTSLWFDEGEVIQLVTFDSETQKFETGLWIVEVEGVPHLRAYSQQSAWLRRLRAAPEVQLTRGGKQNWYRATAIDDDVLRDRVTAAMAEKYGRLNDVMLLFRDPLGAVPIRLDPVAGDRTVGAAR